MAAISPSPPCITTPPGHPGPYLHRTRLSTVLDAAVRHRTTLVLAPAGWGKTTAVAAWARGRDHVVWHGQAPATDAHHPPGAVLVVDDADRCPPEDLRRLLDRVGPHDTDLAPAQLVLLARTEPRVARAAEELHGGTGRVTAATLRFTARESRDLLAALAPDAGDEDVEQAVRRCEGWAALLVIAGRRLATGVAREDASLLDWIDGAVLDGLDPRTRAALLASAGRCPRDRQRELAAVLAGDVVATAHLDALTRDGLLRAGGEGGWVVPPVVVDAVRRREQRPGERRAARAAHRRAAAHLARHGPPAAALEHAARAHDHDTVQALLVDHGTFLVLGGEEELVGAALRGLPVDGPDALLGVAAVLRRSLGDSQGAARLTAAAARAAGPVLQRVRLDGDRPSRAEAALLVDSAGLQAWAARFGWTDVRATLELTASVLGEPLPGATGEVRDPRVVDGVDPARLCLLLRETAALETWAGLLDRAAAHVDRALVTAELIGSSRLRAAALADRCLGQLLLGSLPAAARTAHESLAAAAQAQRPDDGYLARPHLALGWSAFYEARSHEARERLLLARGSLTRSPEPLLTGLALLLEVWLCAQDGDVGEARTLLAGAPPYPDAAPPLLVGATAFAAGQLALLDEDPRAARSHAAVLQQLGSDIGHGLLEAGARELLGHPADAASLLAKVVARVPGAGGEQVVTVLAEATLARLHAQAGQPDAAARRARAAVTRAGGHRFLQPLLQGFGGYATPLLEGVIGLAGGHRFAVTALAASTGGSPRPLTPRSARPTGTRTAAPTGPPVPVPVQMPVPVPVPVPRNGDGHPVPDAEHCEAGGVTGLLTSRERDVLHELALGGSYADTARALHLSENTVKTHVSSLYRKLGADRRASALRRARELGLLRSHG